MLVKGQNSEDRKEEREKRIEKIGFKDSRFQGVECKSTL